MHKKIWILTVIIVSLYLLTLLGIFESKKPIQALDISNLNIQKEERFAPWLYQYDENISQNFHWGLPQAKPTLLQETNETILKSTLVKVEKKEHQNLLCIEESCYRLLSIARTDQDYEAILYNANKKKKIKAYHLNTFLEKGIFIDDISNFKVSFEDNSSQRKWQFKIFDVNQTQYKPKAKND
ncbi:MAG: hypothetical protein U9R50_01435 [Campylobacterota bacterium]|nr:hypothetical protein [Campylobacterota bacterium]